MDPQSQQQTTDSEGDAAPRRRSPTNRSPTRGSPSPKSRSPSRGGSPTNGGDGEWERRHRSPLARSKGRPGADPRARLRKLITTPPEQAVAVRATHAAASSITASPPKSRRPLWELVSDEITAEQTVLTIEYLNPGCAFRVRVYARNVHGWGPPSRPSARFRLPSVPRLSMATRTTLTVKWAQPFLEYLGPLRTGDGAALAGSGSESEGEDYGVQHSLFLPGAVQYCYRVQVQACVTDLQDGCMMWRPHHRWGGVAWRDVGGGEGGGG